MTAAELFAAGRLTDAIAAGIEEVKKQPGEITPRWHLAELLCFTGDLERADKHLETLLALQPAQAISISLFRNLLRAEQARREVLFAGRVPEFLTEPTPAIRSTLAALVAMRAGDLTEAAQHIATADGERVHASGRCDDAVFTDLRDLDDVVAPVLEVLTADGLCVWLPLEHIGRMRFEAPARTRDLLWRRCDLVTNDGTRRDVYIPALYCGTYKEQNDLLRIGRSTEWQEVAPGLTQGRGQREWLVGEDVKPFLELKEVVMDFQRHASQPDNT